MDLLVLSLCEVVLRAGEDAQLRVIRRVRDGVPWGLSDRVLARRGARGRLEDRRCGRAAREQESSREREHEERQPWG